MMVQHDPSSFLLCSLYMLRELPSIYNFTFHKFPLIQPCLFTHCPLTSTYLHPQLWLTYSTSSFPVPSWLQKMHLVQINFLSWVGWCTPLIPAPGRQRQVSSRLVYKSRTAKATQGNPVFEKQNKIKFLHKTYTNFHFAGSFLFL